MIIWLQYLKIHSTITAVLGTALIMDGCNSVSHIFMLFWSTLVTFPVTTKVTTKVISTVFSEQSILMGSNKQEIWLIQVLCENWSSWLTFCPVYCQRYSCFKFNYFPPTAFHIHIMEKSSRLPFFQYHYKFFFNMLLLSLISFFGFCIDNVLLCFVVLCVHFPSFLPKIWLHYIRAADQLQLTRD